MFSETRIQPLHYIFLSYLLFCFGCDQTTAEEKAISAIEARALAKTDSSLLQKAFTVQCGTLEITPIDESANDTSLLRFITFLKQIVQQKDTAAIMELIDLNMVTSHGGGATGKKDFIQHWELQNNPTASALWPTLQRALTLGGCFDKRGNNSSFVMPYLQAGHYFENGCDFDWFITYVCLGARTKIYEKPDASSNVIAELKYRVLETDYDSKIIHSFVPVHTVDQSIKGYVHEKDVYLCADYMLVIDKRYGEWCIKSFSPF